MTLYANIPAITVTSNGSGYTSNSFIATPIGSLRNNTTTGQFELWDGNNWVVASATYAATYIRDCIEKAESEVRKYVNTNAADNVTIQDALSEWMGACERFKVIATLAEHSK
jgi:hypothetical protein